MHNRRNLVPFNSHYFEKKKKDGVSYSMFDTFNHVYKTNHWMNNESISGEGSSRLQTAVIERELPGILASYGINSLLDVPCGDFNWMKNVDLGTITYTGGDIVREIILKNQKLYGGMSKTFLTMDLATDLLPANDMLLCRDCLVHFSYSDIDRVLNNIRHSRITYLFTTTFSKHENNADITTGDWRPINLRLPPFNFPAPLYELNEQCSEADQQFRDKTLALWRISSLPLELI